MRSFALFLLALMISAAPALAQTATEDFTRRIPIENVLMLELDTGRVFIELYPDVAPRHVERIRTLANEGFYDGTIFHRVIEGFMAQGGDPTGTGTGGSSYPDLPAEFSSVPHRRGMTSMARANDPNSANSQFFIMFTDAPEGRDSWSQLDGQYTVWGRVIDGMQYVDAIERGEPPANPTHIVRARTADQEFPDRTQFPAPADIPERTSYQGDQAAEFDPLYETDVNIDILTPVLANP